MDQRIKDASYGYEAVKSALRQTKDGVAITLVIHPSDLPDALLSDEIGSRYMVGMVRLGDNEEIVEPEEVREGKRIVTSAGALCRDNDFQKWMINNGFSEEHTEASASEGLRSLLKIDSRSELNDNKEAQRKYNLIRKSFIDRAILMETDLEP
tara:strand:- start:1127 stop:1585 length:459 start_codon:yes stop_codon:yes gene_type:complete